MAERESQRIHRVLLRTFMPIVALTRNVISWQISFQSLATGALAVPVAIFYPRTGISGGRLTPLIRICHLLKKLWATGAAVISAVADINA